MTPPKLNRHCLTHQERHKLARPTFIASLVLIGFFIVLNVIAGIVMPVRFPIGVFAGVGAVAFILLWYFVALPRFDRYPFLEWMMAALHGAGIGLLYAIQPLGSIRFQDFFVLLVICLTSAVSGRWPSYLFLGIVLAFRGYFARSVLLSYPLDVNLWVGILIVAIILTETIQSLREIILRHLQRMETLKNVARNLASSLETHQVVSLLSAVVQKSFFADTYYVGLLKDEKIHLELFYDDGEFFPSQDVPMEGNLASWVIRNKKSLLLFDLIKDTRRLGIPWVLIGKKRTSQSWMGAPIELGGNMLGLVAVASYTPNAFDQADLSLLESVAQQAALAIDNSYHHAEVEHQSQLDSLTGVYNHGYFLKSLAQEAEAALQNNTSLSLIMLDIDHFKQYNDSYGHLVGDQVLSMLVNNIRTHVKSSDVIGRWGGEEFVIVLRNTSGSQAYMVAERIRQSMNTFIMTEREHKTIPSPTVSQGIALYPGETTDIFKLIDLSDQRLYLAKDRGRNQIEPQSNYWEAQPEEPFSQPLP